MQGLCFVQFCWITTFSCLNQLARKHTYSLDYYLKALDWKHDGAARCQWQSKRRGGTVSSGVLGSRVNGDAKRRLRTERESRCCSSLLSSCFTYVCTTPSSLGFRFALSRTAGAQLRLPGSKSKASANKRTLCFSISGDYLLFRS